MIIEHYHVILLTGVNLNDPHEYVHTHDVTDLEHTHTASCSTPWRSVDLRLIRALELESEPAEAPVE